MHESSDIERSPASPLRHISSKKPKGGRGKGRHQERHAPAKKTQRRLTKEKSVEEPQESHKQKRVGESAGMRELINCQMGFQF